MTKFDVRNIFTAGPSPENTGPIYFGDNFEQTTVVTQLPLQAAVVRAAVALASLIEIKSERAETQAVLRRPRKTKTQSLWLESFFTRLYTKSHVTFGYRERAATLYIFEHPKITNALELTGSIALTDEESRVSVNVRASKVAQILGFYSPVLSQINEAEKEAWEILARSGKTRGYISAGQDFTGLMSYRNAHMRDLLKQVFGKLGEKQTFILPNGYNFDSLPSPSGVELLKPLAEAYCWHYGLPPALMSIDIPSHTATSYSAMRKNFISMGLQPKVRMLIESLREIFNDETIDADYSAIAESTLGDRVIAMKNAAQTGCFTRNALLRQFGFEEIEGPEGDEFPGAAGAPQQFSNQEQGE